MSAHPPTPRASGTDRRGTGPGGRPVGQLGVWLGILLSGLSAAAVALQCYGLYRPDGPPQLRWLPYADKIGHLLGFAVPVLLVTITIAWFTGALTNRIRALVAIVFSVQAAMSELVQGHDALAGRSGDVIDLAADALGIAIGFFAAPPLHRGLARRFGASRR